MSDRLYLSCWVRGFGEASMLRDFEKLLALFPFSKLPRGADRSCACTRLTMRSLRWWSAIFHWAPSQLRDCGSLRVCSRRLLRGSRRVLGSVAVRRRVKLAPAAVTLLCLGPEFENENGDQLRIEFGVDARLPMEGVEGLP